MNRKNSLSKSLTINEKLYILSLQVEWLKFSYRNPIFYENNFVH